MRKQANMRQEMSPCCRPMMTVWMSSRSRTDCVTPCYHGNIVCCSSRVRTSDSNRCFWHRVWSSGIGKHIARNCQSCIIITIITISVFFIAIDNQQADIWILCIIDYASHSFCFHGDTAALCDSNYTNLQSVTSQYVCNRRHVINISRHKTEITVQQNKSMSGCNVPVESTHNSKMSLCTQAGSQLHLQHWHLEKNIKNHKVHKKRLTLTQTSWP